jgi:acyl-coenzyme A thioesterase PaaI-like protein
MRLPFTKSTRSKSKEAKSADPTADPTSVHWIRTLWDQLSPLPGGNRLFSRLLGRRIPYTGTIRAEVLRLAPGYASLQMKDRSTLRNHVHSLHAVALCNLAELTGNAALAYDLPPDARFIVTELTMRYLKKARGTISSRCQCAPVTTNERKAYPLEVQLFDTQGDLVATASIQTLVGPIR